MPAEDGVKEIRQHPNNKAMKNLMLDLDAYQKMQYNSTRGQQCNGCESSGVQTCPHAA
jgi:hypothetical protein